MLIEKEVFDKFAKLISTGMIQTSAKNIQGLNLNDILNLPLIGTQIINLRTTNQNINYIDSKYNDTTFNTDLIQNSSIEKKLRIFLNKILILLENNSTVIDKKEINFSFYLTLKNCNIIKNDCIMDSNNLIYNYIIKFGHTKSESKDIIKSFETESNFINLLTYIYNLINTKYTNDIINLDFSKYEVLDSLKTETFDILSNGVEDEENTITEETNLWFQDLIDNIYLYIDFELGIIDHDSPINFPMDIEELFYSPIQNQIT